MNAALIAKWFIVSLITLGALVSVTQVGKQRRPLTGGSAATVVAINALIVALIVIFWRS